MLPKKYGVATGCCEAVKMLWLACPLIFLFARTSMCENESALEEEITSMLYDAATDVLAQNSEPAYRPRHPPAFNMPADFMRSFQPGTGVGNREELVVEYIIPLPVFDDTRFSRFLFKHFNNTDYIVGVSDNSVILYRVNASSQEYLVLSGDEAVFAYDVEWPIIDVVLFTRFVRNSESMYIAIATENEKNSVIYVHEIVGDNGVLAAVISRSSSSVNKIAFLQSSYGGYLAFLTNKVNEARLVYKQQGHSEVNHYIEVEYPAPVDLVTFMVHGHGYIAVANHGFCDVFKMDQYVGSHKVFDRLGPFLGIVDLEYFRLGFHHYLTIVDSRGNHLYTWTKGEFAPKQKLEILNVAQAYAAPVESCRDEVILVSVTKDGQAHFHVYNGQTEDFMAIDAAVPEGYLIKPGSVTSFSYQDAVVILFVDFYHEHRAFVIKTSLKPLKDTFLVKGEKISKAMKDIQSMIENQNKEINRIKEILKDAVRKTGTQYISSVQYFRDLSATNETEVEKINQFELEWEDSSLTLEEYKKGTNDLKKNVEYLEKLVKDIEKTLPDVVRLDEENVITGKKIFTGHVSADTLMATSLNLPTVAGMDLNQILKDIYRLDRPEKIEGTLMFQEPLTITTDLDIEHTVNGIDIGEEVMTTNTEQTSYAEMIFMNKLTINGDLLVSGRVNDIDISEEVVTLNGKHHIYGKKNFMNGIKARNVYTKYLDGVDIDDLYKRAFTISGNQTIAEDAMFSIVTTNNINLNGFLNGYDIDELAKNIVRIDRPTTVTGFKNFVNDVTIDGELTVHGTVNGLKIPDDLVLTDRPQTITGTKEFIGRVTAHEMHVQGKVDGLRIPEDIVTLSMDEEISSTLHFADGIVAEKNIVVEGLVDDVDISEVAKEAMKLNETNEFDNAIFLGPVTITGNLDVSGLVNKVDLNRILKDIVYKDEGPIKIFATKYFQELAADKVTLDGTINGFNLLIDFMQVHGNQAIDGRKTFKNVVFNSVRIEDDMIGGLNITDLYQRRLQIVIDEDFEVNEEIEFVDNVIVEGDLTVHGTIGGLKIPEDIVLRNSDQSISNKHFADRVIVDNLIIGGNINVDFLDGKNLTEFYNDRVTLSGHQTIQRNLWLGDVTADKVSVSGFVNGLNITSFANNVMSKTKPQTVTAVKEFSGDVFVAGDIYTGEGVNRIKLSDINARVFKLLGDNLVTAPLEFEDNITFNGLIVTGDINGINITRLNEDSLKKAADIQYVKGNVAFLKGFHVTGDIIATHVNGLNLQDDVLLNTIPQTITGQFTFDNLVIGGDLTVAGSINGLDLSEVAPKLARINDVETVIESDITFASKIHVIEDIEVTGTVNEVELKELFDNVLRKTGDQIVTGHKVFRGNVTIMGNIDVKSVNGIRWDEFLDDVVWINVPQEIKSSKTFADDITVRKDMLVSGVAYARLINGKDLREFINDAVFIDEPVNITGPIIFKTPVEITGDMNADLINGLNLRTDVITIACSDDGPQRITGLKTFQKIRVSGDVYTDSVNSLDLLKLYEDTLLTEGNQNVTGWKVIHGDVVFKRNVYPNLVNGMILKSDLVTLNTEQIIEGPLIFQGDVFVEKDLLIKGYVNGVDLNKLKREAVYLGTEQVIEGSYSLQSARVAANVEVNGTVNGMDLRIFDRNVTEFLKDTRDSIKDMEREVQDLCELAKDLQESLENSYYALDSFVIYQELDLEASFIQVASNQDITLVHLDDSASSAVSVQNVWDVNAKQFQTWSSSQTLIARSFLYRIGSVVVTINIGISSKDSSVILGRTTYSAAVETGFSDASVVLTKTDVAVALLFPSKSVCNIYLVKEHPEKESFDLDGSLDVGKESKSIALFEVSGVLYLAVSSTYSVYGTSSKIFVKVDGTWQQLQRISTLGSIVKHFAYHGYHYLVFVNDAPVHESKEPKSLQVYRNTGPNGRFALFQKIPFDDSRGMEVFRFGDLSQHHLVSWNGTVVQIFGLEGESGMKELFTIHGDCIRDVKPLLIENDLYLIVGRQNLKIADAVNSVLYKGITKGVKYDPYDLSYCWRLDHYLP